MDRMTYDDLEHLFYHILIKQLWKDHFSYFSANLKKSVKRCAKSAASESGNRERSEETSVDKLCYVLANSLFSV